MPITKEFQPSEQREHAGIPRAAAILIAEKIEEAAQTTHDSALDRFREEFRTLRQEMATMEARLTSKIAEAQAATEKSIRGSQTVLPSAIGLAVAILAALRFMH